MASVKLGRKTFDVNSEVITAAADRVTAADCAALAARMKTGEISRVKTLALVRFFSVFHFLNSTEPQFFCRATITSEQTALVLLQRACEPTAPWKRLA